jgi:hypothetical protein
MFPSLATPEGLFAEGVATGEFLVEDLELAPLSSGRTCAGPPAKGIPRPARGRTRRGPSA